MVINPVVGCPHLPPGTQQHTHAYHEPGARLPLLSARPAVTFTAVGRHRLSASTNLHCLVTEAHRCEKRAQGFYTACPAETRTHDLLIASPTLYHSATTPDRHESVKFRTSQRAVIPCSRESNRNCGITVATCHRLSDVPTDGCRGLKEK